MRLNSLGSSMHTHSRHTAHHGRHPGAGRDPVDALRQLMSFDIITQVCTDGANWIPRVRGMTITVWSIRK